MLNKIGKHFKKAVRGTNKDQRQIAARILGLPNPNVKRPLMKHPVRNALLLAAAGYGAVFEGYPRSQDAWNNHCPLDQVSSRDRKMVIGQEALRFLWPKPQAYIVTDEPLRLRACPQSGEDNALIIHRLNRDEIVYSFNTIAEQNSYRDEPTFVPVRYRLNGHYVTGYVATQFLLPMNNTAAENMLKLQNKAGR